MDTPFGAPSDTTDWHFITPQLPVADLRATQVYYRDVIDFNIAWIWREEYGAAHNGTTEIFFVREEGKIQPSCSFARVENADEVLAIYREREVKIVEEIASQPYGMHEFSIENNNGHRFRIGHGDGPVTPSVGSRFR